jgi:LPS O-antigen subunit length determinant protein (WzzB/FepE family)
MSKENPIHHQDQALIERIHARHIERIGVLGDEAIQFQDASYAVGRQRGAKEANDALLADLIEAAATLRRYETLHRAKGTDDSTGKAEVNAALATRFEATVGNFGQLPTKGAEDAARRVSACIAACKSISTKALESGDLNNFELQRDRMVLTQQRDELISALEEVLRISDRKHDAWDRARAAIASAKAEPLNPA